VKILRILIGLLAGLLVAAALAMVVVYVVTNRHLNKTYRVEVPHIVTSDDSVTLARGRHVAEIRGCTQCHNPDLGGHVVIDAMPLLGRIMSANLTSGRNGVAAQYKSNEDWVRAIRDGVRPDGKPLVFMPSYEYRSIGPADLGALVSYLKSAKPVASPPLKETIGPLARVLYLLGRFPLIPAEMINHTDRTFTEPQPGETVAYGRYLAGPCAGCHGRHFSGGKVPGTPPGWPLAANLTPDSATGLGSWNYAQFSSFFDTGRTPDGRQVDPKVMPWPVVRAMTDGERRALWEFLRSLPPLPKGSG
jgi:mono/diheme cytochrome c family protein